MGNYGKLERLVRQNGVFVIVAQPIWVENYWSAHVIDRLDKLDEGVVKVFGVSYLQFDIVA